MSISLRGCTSPDTTEPKARIIRNPNFWAIRSKSLLFGSGSLILTGSLILVFTILSIPWTGFSDQERRKRLQSWDRRPRLRPTGQPCYNNYGSGLAFP